MNTYKYISNFGCQEKSDVNHPLTYCMGSGMDQRFLHGGYSDNYGQHSKNCQLFMSEYCAKKWDGFCEVASRNTQTNYPSQIDGVIGLRCLSTSLTAGETLIRNTAARKYLIKMNGAYKNYEPFDPLVANSPMISYWVNNRCYSCNSGIPEYAVDPEKIDDDIVMNKILKNPGIAINILINIYNTMKRYKTLSKLKGTKLGKYYETNPYFKSKGGILV